MKLLLDGKYITMQPWYKILFTAIDNNNASIEIINIKTDCLVASEMTWSGLEKDMHDLFEKFKMYVKSFEGWKNERKND